MEGFDALNGILKIVSNLAAAGPVGTGVAVVAVLGVFGVGFLILRKYIKTWNLKVDIKDILGIGKSTGETASDLAKQAEKTHSEMDKLIEAEKKNQP